MPTTKWMKIRSRLCLDDNPLIRRADRVAALIPLGAIVAFLVLSPIAAGASGAWMRADDAAARQAQRHLHPVAAVLLTSAPGPEFSDHGLNTWYEPMRARWSVGGRHYTGYVPTPAKTPAGSTVTVWLSAGGKVHAPPMTAAQARDRVRYAELAGLAVLALLMAIVAVAARRIMDRRRLASWQTEWLTVGPQWSRHT
jgi:hypothetical protein